MANKAQILTVDDFKKKIFDYSQGGQWAFKGDRPVIIDFYATWCGPCQRLAPVLDELANEYEGQVDIFKVDTDQEQELASLFEIRSVPSILFIPKTGAPQMAAGALPKETLYTAIKDILGC